MQVVYSVSNTCTEQNRTEKNFITKLKEKSIHRQIFTYIHSIEVSEKGINYWDNLRIDNSIRKMCLRKTE